MRKSKSQKKEGSYRVNNSTSKSRCFLMDVSKYKTPDDFQTQIGGHKNSQKKNKNNQKRSPKKRKLNKKEQQAGKIISRYARKWFFYRKFELSGLSKIPELVEIKPLKVNNYGKWCQQQIKKFPNLEVISILYKSDGLKIHGYLFKRKCNYSKKAVVIYCHGGNNHPRTRCGHLNNASFFYNQSLLPLVNEGKIVVFASNYRGSQNKQQISEGVDEFCGRDINDTLNLYPIIKQCKFADSNKIGLVGWSRGCTTALLVHRETDWSKCLALGAGLYNLLAIKKFRPALYKIFKEKKYFNLTVKEMKKRSALSWVNKLRPVPILLLHGSADWRSPAEGSLEMGVQFLKYKIPYKLVIYPGGDHSLSEFKKERTEEIMSHLEKYLVNQEKIDLTPHGY